jgi:hypothetical protein
MKMATMVMSGARTSNIEDGPRVPGTQIAVLCNLASVAVCGTEVEDGASDTGTNDVGDSEPESQEPGNADADFGPSQFRSGSRYRAAIRWSPQSDPG